MTQAEFLDFARAAATRATATPGRIGNLVLTQERAENEPTLREPELRTALQQEADHRGLLYGIEVPTACTYQFTGEGRRRALTDFALLDSASPNATCNVLVELKEGQPSRKSIENGGETVADFPAISKDLHKLLAERVNHGRCMFHICQATDSGTIRALVDKYDAAMRNALSSASGTISLHPDVAHQADAERGEPWFVLLFLVLRQRGKAFAGQGACLHVGTWDGARWIVDRDGCFP